MPPTVDVIRLERTLPLSPEQSFELWTDPEMLARWWGPRDEAGKPFQAGAVDWQAREGTAWSIVMTAPDGRSFRQGGRIIEVDRPRRLRFSFRWEEDGARGPSTEITVAFEPVCAGTRLTFTQTGFATAASRDGHVQGWAECLDRLAGTAESEAA